MGTSENRSELVSRLREGSLTAEALVNEYGAEEAAWMVAEALLHLPADAELDDEGKTILNLLDDLFSDELLTVVAGLLWREDIAWLDSKMEDGKETRLRLLRYVASRSAGSLSPLFWRSVGERGVGYLDTAFSALKSNWPRQAAPLLVKLCEATVADHHQMDIRNTVDTFLDKGDASVRSAFLDAMRHVPQVKRRKIMTHLDISLMAELDSSAIEHKGESFFYDGDAEKKKRDEKSKDIFAEVARRLESGETRD